ncbi:MAG TPA: hypothetical protein VI260_27295 [Blastocatellia bacterium]|jgi:hypothetical protein
MRPANVELHIEELVLHGFAPGDRYRIGEAVERELQRLFAEQGAPAPLAQSAERGYLDGGTFESPRAASAETIGAGIAQNLYGGLK